MRRGGGGKGLWANITVVISLHSTRVNLVHVIITQFPNLFLFSSLYSYKLNSLKHDMLQIIVITYSQQQFLGTKYSIFFPFLYYLTVFIYYLIKADNISLFKGSLLPQNSTLSLSLSPSQVKCQFNLNMYKTNKLEKDWNFKTFRMEKNIEMKA